MKFTVQKTNLINALQKVQNIITTKTALPILSNILLETQKGQIKLTTTDLDIGISCVIPVDIQEEGNITVPGKRFADIIRELPEENIIINSKKNNLVTIETELCQFKVMGLSYEEFPKLPEFKDKEVIKIEQLLLREMLGMTSFAVSYDETRYILNGVLFKIKKNTLILVATDGKRLAFIERKIKHDIDKEVDIIVPIKTIQELNRNLSEESDKELFLTVGNNQVLFDLGGVVIISRLIEGEFPDYKRVIIGESENKLVVNRQEFLLAIKRAALLATPDYQAVKLEVFKNKLVVSKSTPDVGESRETLTTEYKGKELVIGFNPGYLIDVLKNLSDEKITLELTDSETQGVIRKEGYIYLALPMRLS